MDPNAVATMILDDNYNCDERRDAVLNLTSWLERGGFAPNVGFVSDLRSLALEYLRYKHSADIWREWGGTAEPVELLDVLDVLHCAIGL